MNTSIVNKKVVPWAATPEGITIENTKQNNIIKVIDLQEVKYEKVSYKYEDYDRVPKWMMEKVLRLVTDRNDIEELRGGKLKELLQGLPRQKMMSSLHQLELEATIFLQSDLVLKPEIACFVPEDFVNALKVSSCGSTLTPKERSTIVIIQADADECGMWITPSSIDEFLVLKWEALGRLLKEATHG